jgi:hypothetical protein
MFRSTDGINWIELFEFTTLESENITCFEEDNGTFYFGTSAGFSKNSASVTKNCGNIYMIRKAFLKRKVNMN